MWKNSAYSLQMCLEFQAFFLCECKVCVFVPNLEHATFLHFPGKLPQKMQFFSTKIVELFCKEYETFPDLSTM